MAGIVSFSWTETKSWYTKKNGNLLDVTVNFNNVRRLTIRNVSDGCVDDFRVLVNNGINDDVFISPCFDTYAEAKKHYLKIVKLFHATENSVVLYNYDSDNIEYLD